LGARGNETQREANDWEQEATTGFAVPLRDFGQALPALRDCFGRLRRLAMTGFGEGEGGLGEAKPRLSLRGTQNHDPHREERKATTVPARTANPRRRERSRPPAVTAGSEAAKQSRDASRALPEAPGTGRAGVTRLLRPAAPARNDRLR